ncbi:hypothetical protein HUW51_12230 [Adhaeribacter swui]|uniref:DUF3784 domain-containing protein n=1 Tax=Adhaeribacter swui TaxID=2086471 RepID=A0A7G7G8G5_9BACT|nr:hypothetical protein [Adhaeribacter swui]QNF33449.1 hypothetical protein HUW51_12230 [Adhaeribacter swui]
MQPNSIILMVVFSSCGILLGWIGNHIRKKQSIESIMLPGLIVKNVKDKKALSTFVGNNLSSMGFISLLIAGSILLLPTVKMIVLLMFLVALIAICIRLILGLRKFNK